MYINCGPSPTIDKHLTKLKLWHLRKARYTLATKPTSPKSATKSTDLSWIFLTLSPILLTLSQILLTLSPTHYRFVESRLSPARSTLSSMSQSTLSHVQLCRLCWRWVIFVAQISNVLLTLSRVCTGPKRHNRSCWIRLCYQCVPGLSNYVTKTVTTSNNTQQTIIFNTLTWNTRPSC